MPNRIIREGILDSERVDQLDAETEIFYRRVLNVVDDYGRFDARPAVLIAACYPGLVLLPGKQLENFSDEEIFSKSVPCSCEAGRIFHVDFAIRGDRCMAPEAFESYLRAIRRVWRLKEPGREWLINCAYIAKYQTVASTAEWLHSQGARAGGRWIA